MNKYEFLQIGIDEAVRKLEDIVKDKKHQIQSNEVSKYELSNVIKEIDDIEEAISVFKDLTFNKRETMNQNKKTCDFNKLALGTRFRYINGTKVFVKIAYNTIAAWDESQIDTHWVGQGIYSARDHEDDELVVEIIG